MVMRSLKFFQYSGFGLFSSRSVIVHPLGATSSAATPRASERTIKFFPEKHAACCVRAGDLHDVQHKGHAETIRCLYAGVVETRSGEEAPEGHHLRTQRE